jgi:hypothetical protein
LVQLSVSLADARQSLEEQETMVLSLQHTTEDARQALEAEKKQVEGELSSIRSLICRFAFLGIRSQLSFSCSWFSGLRTALGNTTTHAEAM